MQQRAAGTKNTALFDIVKPIRTTAHASRGSACRNRLILRDGEAVVSKDGAAPVDLRALMVRDAPKALLTIRRKRARMIMAASGIPHQ